MSEAKSFNDILEEQMELQKEAANEALEEYMDNLKETNSPSFNELNSLLKDNDYNEKFKQSVMQMSILLSAAMAIEDEEHEYIKIQKKVLSFAKNDDKFTKEMRLTYSQSITADELNVLDTQESKDRYTKRMESFVEAISNFA